MAKETPACAAAVDLGSNTFRLLIGRREGAALRVLVNRLEPVGLGRGLSRDGTLADDGLERAMAALTAFAREQARWPTAAIRACGTEALRQASNSAPFLARAAELLGCPVEVIRGEEEARLSLLGVLSGQPAAARGPLLLADVGGGSTELIVSADGRTPSTAQSLPLGVIALTEAFPCHGRLPADLAGMARWIRERLRPALAVLPADTASWRVMACGGSATALAALDLALPRYGGRRIQGHCLSRGRLWELFQRLCDLTVAERNQLPGLDRGRGEILPAGARIYEILLQTLGSSAMIISDAGLLEGILLSQFPGQDLSIHKENEP